MSDDGRFPVSPTRFARRGIARLAYETAGPAGPTVLLLHDLLAPRASLAAWRDALARAGGRVILPDLRGHGASAAIPRVRYTVAELVLDALAVLDAEAASPVAALGVGLGGTIGLDLARVAGERVSRLLLIDPLVPGLWREDAAPEQAAAFTAAREEAAAIADLANRGAIDRAFDRYFAARFGPGWRTRHTPAQLGAMRRHSAAFGTLLTAAYAYQPVLPLPRPTLLLTSAAESNESDHLMSERWLAAGARPLAPATSDLIPPASLAFLLDGTLPR